ncbi:MAG: ergothioneine biosynthesis protein EgtB, partial [Gemmatimonadetes bacterium]|nr:ergothioneine biosynthesis protein EgtB [Gemmatimonadota bacterium]
LTDIKHVLSVNPLRPEYQAGSGESHRGALVRESPTGRPSSRPSRSADGPSLEWVGFPEGLVEIGADGKGFTFDNERPRHRHFVEAFALASRPVNNGEITAFIADGGYERGELWLSEGWATAQERGWTEPFYWEKKDGEWWTYTLAGARPVEPEETACHLTYFEADAYARWAGARLPSEQEWEVAAQGLEIVGNMARRGRFHPEVAAPPQSDGRAEPSAGSLRQMFGDVWEWTRSQYSPYPGYQALPGTLGEYNGKFMSNQFVLRGGSCVTPDDHIRVTYRNFFPADAAWQFSGIRLARDAG